MTRTKLLVKEIRLSDLSIRHIDDLAERKLRGKAPQLLLCPIHSIGHTSVIVSAPLNTYLAGICRYPSFYDGLVHYTENALVSSEAVYKGVLEEAKKSGLTRESFPRPFFLPYAGWGAYTAKRQKGFGKEFAGGAALDKRILSFVVPDSHVSRVIDYCNALFEQTGGMALVDGPEVLNDLVSARGFDEIPSASRVAYESPHYPEIAANSFASDEQHASVVDSLRQLVDRVAKVGPGALKLFPLHLAKVAPSIYVSKAASKGSLAWRRALLRSELIGHLKFVWHYSPVKIQVEQVNADDGGQIGAQIIENLNRYLQDTESQYPVVLANPIQP